MDFTRNSRAMRGDHVNDTSRRDFLGSLRPFAIVPLICATPELAFAEYDGEANGARLRAQTVITDEVKTVTVKKVHCPDWPLQSLGAVTVHGEPRATGKTVFETKDRQITGGIWKCSPGTFDLTFTWDEMALLLEGELIIEESSERKVQILPGDFFFVPRGAKTRWTVVKPLKKLFFSRE
jgi:uncharacterized protein